MIVQCRELRDEFPSGCGRYFDDEFRSTECPHETFAANDGHNNFAHHPESYLSDDAPRLK